jgi:hypothetical protein
MKFIILIDVQYLKVKLIVDKIVHRAIKMWLKFAIKNNFIFNINKKIIMLQQPLTGINYPLRCNLHFECFCIKKYSIEIVVKLQQVEWKEFEIGNLLVECVLW